MTFTPRDWVDGETVTAVKMEDLEGRLSAYTDLSPGSTVSYVEFSTDVSISGTTEAAANTVVTAGAFTPTGMDDYWVEFFCPAIQTGASTGAQIRLALYDNGNPISAGTSTVAIYLCPAAATALLVNGYAKRRLVTPSAVSHTYSIRGWRLVANGTVNGTTAGITTPGYICVTKAT